MNIQWINQRSNGNEKRACLRAVLSESYKDNGNVQRRSIAELGSIEERYLSTHIKGTRAFHQGLFWVVVDKKLDKLRLEPGVRNQIEGELLKKIPRPEDDWAMWGVICVPKFDNISESGKAG
jgi:hypothetical protein